MATQIPAPTRTPGTMGMRIVVCASRWNPEIVDQLVGSAVGTLKGEGATVESIHRCAGVFELAPLCARLARKGGIDGIVALGCLIRGETDHYDLLAAEVTRALGSLALEAATSPRALAIAFGVLACETEQQARERAKGRLDKGREAALACIEQVEALRAVGD